MRLTAGLLNAVLLLATACAPSPAANTPAPPPPATSTSLPSPASVPASSPAASPSPSPARSPAVPAASPSPFASPSPSPPALRLSPDSEANRLAVRLETALNQGNVDAALALFGEEAEVKIPPDLYRGESQIRGWLSYLAANRFQVEPGPRQAIGDRVSWPAEVTSDYLVKLGLPSVSGTVTVALRPDGRISSYSFVLTREWASRHRAAQLAAANVLQDPVIVGADSANVYSFNDVFRDAEGRLVSYRDVLTSEPGASVFFDLGGEPIIVRSGF